jgi:hypothetical protein
MSTTISKNKKKKTQNKDAFIECEDTYKDDFSGFIDNHSGYSPTSKWFDRVQKTHRGLRTSIDGIHRDLEVDIPDGACVQTPNKCDRDNVIVNIIDDILRYMPKYLETYDLKKEDLYNSTLPSGIKTIKHISTYVSRNKDEIKRPNIYNAHVYAHMTPLYCRDYITRSLSGLGKHHAESVTQKQTLHIRLTTAASAFFNLGHYNSDNKSCFGQGRENETHKYILGQTPDTYVILIAKNDDFENNNNILARAWGFTNSTHTVFNICNLYKKILNEASIFYAIEQLIKDIKDVDKVKCASDIIRARGVVYLNESPLWTFYSSNKEPNEQFLDDDDTDIDPDDYGDNDDNIDFF